jgi:hypothetical protein
MKLLRQLTFVMMVMGIGAFLAGWLVAYHRGSTLSPADKIHTCLLISVAASGIAVATRAVDRD